MKELINADDSNFDNLLNDEKAIIVDFWSPTCAPCKLLEPILKNVASEYNEEVSIIRINVNECPKTSSKYMIRGLPTLLFIKDKNVNSQLIGAVNPAQIEQNLKKII